LAASVQTYPEKAVLAHFYLGACQLARFLLAGGRDTSLRENALDNFRRAKEAGFRAENLEVSPKIMQVYEQVTF
jgi:hypothetical protein